MSTKTRHPSILRLYEVAGTKKHKDIADALNVAPSVITNWSSRGVSKDGALDSVKLWGGSANYILTGDGTPLNQLETGGISEWDSNTPLDDDEVEVVFFKDVSFACGSGSIGEALDTEKRRLRISKSTLRRLGIEASNVFTALADDRSMSPMIEPKDVIYVDRGRTNIKDGKVYAIDHGGMFRCKILYQMPNQGVRIYSKNEDEYPEETLTAEQRIEQNFHIIGWVWNWSHEETW